MPIMLDDTLTWIEEHLDPGEFVDILEGMEIMDYADLLDLLEPHISENLDQIRERLGC